MSKCKEWLAHHHFRRQLLPWHQESTLSSGCMADCPKGPLRPHAGHMLLENPWHRLSWCLLRSSVNAPTFTHWISLLQGSCFFFFPLPVLCFSQSMYVQCSRAELVQSHPPCISKESLLIYLFVSWVCFICGMQWDSFAWLQVSLDFMSTAFQNKPNFTQTFS